MADVENPPLFARPSPGRGAVVGALGGVVGAAFFGVVLWIQSPDVVSVAIPAFYGLGESPLQGWLLHLVHGAMFGVIFGFVVTRPLVFGVLTEPVQTDILQNLGASVRFGLVGVVYGIAIWTIVPFLGMSVLGVLQAQGDPGFPGIAADIMVGHMIFGVIVGIVFSVVVPRASESASPN